MGTWIVAQDGPDKVIKVDGAAYKATLRTRPTRLLLDNARKLYGTINEELMDNAKQFPYSPSPCCKNSPTVLERHDQREVQDDRGRRRPRVGHSVQRQAERRLAVRALQRHRAQRRRCGSSTTASGRREVQRPRRSRSCSTSRPHVARTRADRRRRRHHRRALDGASRSNTRSARRPARPQRRGAESRSVPGEQPGAAPAGQRQGRPVVEDRQHRANSRTTSSAPSKQDLDSEEVDSRCEASIVSAAVAVRCGSRGGRAGARSRPNTAAIVVVGRRSDAGAVVKDAKVTVINGATGATRDVDVRRRRLGQRSALPLTGTLHGHVAKAGFTAEDVKDLTLRAGETATVQGQAGRQRRQE